MKTKMADFYLSYLNEFLTIEHFAEYHDMSINQTQTILTIGRMFHEERCAPDICPHCNGSGEGQHEGSRCNYCKGKGEI